MKTFIIKTTLTIMLAYLFQQFLPWWSVVFSALIINMILPSSASKSFFTGFTGIALLWLLYAGFITYREGQVLTEKMALLFHLPSPSLLLIITALIGGVPGGLGALCGHYLRSLVIKKRDNIYRSPS